MTTLRAPFLLSALGLATLLACTHGGGDGGDGSDDSSVDDTEVADDTNGGISVSGTVRGTVTVQLYDDSTGERLYVDYADVGYDSFPFGKIFVGAYTESEEGEDGPAQEYWGDTTIDSPNIEGDAYEMDVEVEGTDTVWVYAHLDWHQDRVLGTNDPTGHHPVQIVIPDGGSVEDVDITILAPVYCGERANPNCGGPCDTMTISGDVVIAISWAGGDVATYLQGTDGSGPYHVTWDTPTADGGGASTAYELTSCQGRGEVRLRGAWDRNGNELIDPRDRYGAYSASVDGDGNPEDSNPISVASTNLSGYDVVIPLGDEDPFAVVPFTAVSGTVSMEGGGTFDSTLPSGTDVYVAALKYQPQSELSLSQLEAYSYGYEVWDASALSGVESVSFNIPVPSDTIVYMWAYGDTDGDGMINESGEYVGTPNGSTTGRVPTGRTGVADLDVRLALPGG
ncbi:MAG: hypothetical protein H6739_30440 [Alphaproteobacteria bacterium]|nr:hypothetical protein [Alphaproteobacteria bacterium]